MSGEATAYDLKEHIFNAVLSDCADIDERLRHAVQWGLADMVRKLLQVTESQTGSMDEDNSGSFWGRQRRLLLDAPTTQERRADKGGGDGGGGGGGGGGREREKDRYQKPINNMVAAITRAKDLSRGYTLGMGLLAAAKTRREGDYSSAQSLKVVENLLDFHVEAKYVVFDRLFDREVNRYAVPGWGSAAPRSNKRSNDRELIEARFDDMEDDERGRDTEAWAGGGGGGGGGVGKGYKFKLRGTQLVAELGRMDEKDEDGKIGVQVLQKQLEKVGYGHNIDARSSPRRRAASRAAAAAAAGATVRSRWRWRT